ncbi:MAG TPA: alpha-galactosidase [Actinomycetes bacterium]|nr:alpha-galactosidase [Actinomycetes bacterium]
MNAPNGVVHLRAGGVSLVLDARGGAGEPLPVVLHWGPDLGAELDGEALAEALVPPVASSAVAGPVRRRLLPMPVDGWRLRPGLSGARADGTGWSPRFLVGSVDIPEDRTGAVVEAEDTQAGLALTTTVTLHPSGVLEMGHRLRNLGPASYLVAQLAATLPLPDHAAELLDLTGRWCRERIPQRHRLLHGAWVREARHGRTGHDATLVLAAGTPGFGFRSGEVWAVHLGWSGNAVHWADRNADGHAGLGAAELLAAAEVVLAPGEEYATPPLFAAYSAAGLDGLTAAYHRYIRDRPSHPGTPRLVVLNTWEAVYFDHRLERLAGLAELAARLGVERFVLDDGWFRHRRDDTAGLGDWYVAEDVWPQGLHPLIERVRSLGMEFGLWVEPEMVNPDSDLFRAHPDWVLSVPGRLPPAWRNQQVLDLANPDCYAYLRDRLDALLAEHDIAFLKWDHNRDLIEAGHAGRPGVHAQTLAVYRLLDELRGRHPSVEIESCASGGGRVDLGILARTDRVWASDTNDALERQHIQRWTQLLLPPELVGTHVGPPRAHTTSRTHTLAFRVATAIFGHFGIEWDIAAASAEDQLALAEAVALYRRMRPLLHSGAVVRADRPDPSAYLHGVVAQDRAEALFAYVQLAASAQETPGPARLPGLAADRAYRVTPLAVAGGPETRQAVPPRWYEAGGATLTGKALAEVGLPLPVLRPEQALLLHVTREAS